MDYLLTWAVLRMQVGEVGATMVPETHVGNPVLASSWGERLKSPAIMYGMPSLRTHSAAL